MKETNAHIPIVDEVSFRWAVYAKALLDELILLCGDPVHARQIIELDELIKGHKNA